MLSQRVTIFCMPSQRVINFCVCSLIAQHKGNLQSLIQNMYAQQMLKEFRRTLSKRRNDWIAARANAECILVYAESPRKFFFFNLVFQTLETIRIGS
jgi:hypothetical protein